MNLFVRLSIYLYGRMLRLYPSDFRNEFADEMLAVFITAVTDAQRQGRLSLLTRWGWEFISLPITIVKELWHSLRGEESYMNQMTTFNHTDDANDARAESPLSILAGILPFILFGLISTLDGIVYQIQPSWASFATNGYQIVSAITLIGLGVGLALGFPRWSFAYLGFVVLNLFWEQWIPLLALTVATLLLAHYLKSLNRLVQGIRLDWTLLSFTLYAALTGLFLLATYDLKSSYNQTIFLPLNKFLLTLVLTGGAYFYMVNQRPWSRALALTAALILWMPVSAVVAALDGHQEFVSPSTAFGWVSYIFILLFWTTLPLLPGIAQNLWLRFRTI